MTGHVADTPTARGIPPVATRPDINCIDVNPEIFFPTAKDDAGRVDTRPARRICRRCPAQGECLKWALDTNQRFGIWAGTTPAERKQLLAARGTRTGRPA